jgi:hypothetical protein
VQDASQEEPASPEPGPQLEQFSPEAYKKAYRKRSVWVEPLFGEGKDWHGMR